MLVDEGLCEGFRVGLGLIVVGLTDGFKEEPNVTIFESYEGSMDGSFVGFVDGLEVGLLVKGLCDGCCVGSVDGLVVGLLLEGLFEGWRDR